MALFRHRQRHKVRTSLGKIKVHYVTEQADQDDFRLESKMSPASESTMLEGEGSFIDFVGSGKLKDKKVIITGGEYVLEAWLADGH